MVNTTRKGNYYSLKTRKWLEADGYVVAKMETRQRIWTKNGPIYRGGDIFGADLLALHEERDEIIFVQVKANKGDVAKGMRELAAHPYPSCVTLWVVHWPLRAREPEVTEVLLGKEEE